MQVCKTLCKTWKARSCPLYLTLALPPPPPFFFFFFFFCFLKNLLRLKINIVSSIYPEINFPAEPVIKINNLSRPKVPGHPLRIKWSSPYYISQSNWVVLVDFLINVRPNCHFWSCSISHSFVGICDIYMYLENSLLNFYFGFDFEQTIPVYIPTPLVMSLI